MFAIAGYLSAFTVQDTDGIFDALTKKSACSTKMGYNDRDGLGSATCCAWCAHLHGILFSQDLTHVFRARRSEKFVSTIMRQPGECHLA